MRRLVARVAVAPVAVARVTVARVAVALAALGGCRGPGQVECTDLSGGEFPNHVQPSDEVVDAAHRRVWSTSLADATVGEIDADAGVQLSAPYAYESTAEFPVIAVAPDGALWLGQRSQPALERREVDGTILKVAGVDSASAIVALPDGGVVAFGRSAERRTLVRADASATLIEQVPAEEVNGLMPWEDGVATLGADLEVRGPHLEVISTCPLPFEAVKGARLADGSVVVDDGQNIGWTDCLGHSRSWVGGTDNEDVVAWGSGAYVLDRIGPDDPNFGVAWWVQPPSAQDVGELVGTVTYGFRTEKGSGFGGLDPVTDTLWANAEGTGQILGWSVPTGAPRAAVRTGLWVDGLAIDPADSGRTWATGRLSDTMVAMEGGGCRAQRGRALAALARV